MAHDDAAAVDNESGPACSDAAASGAACADAAGADDFGAAIAEPLVVLTPAVSPASGDRRERR